VRPAHGSQSLAFLRPNKSQPRSIRRSNAKNRPLCTYTHNDRDRDPYVWAISSNFHPPLRRSSSATLYIFDNLTSLTMLMAELPWKILTLVFLHTALHTLVGAKPPNDECFCPNGDVARPGRPCNDDGNPGNCCSPGFVCMNTGICKLKGYEVYERQSCTDDSWLDPSCSEMCLSGMYFVSRFPVMMVGI